jgi:phospholipid/cholesterol/gamma-HCH transport system ATP-binding protein
MNSILRFSHVSKSFGSNVVLSDVSTQFYGRDFTFVMGRSGIGKSVFCKLAVGLLRPDAGDVELFNLPVQRLTEAKLLELRRRAPYLVQHPALVDWLTVWDNLRLVTADDQRIARALADLDLSSLSRRRPTELGPGAKKRVSLARALAYDPAFILLDEPTTGLDPSQAAQVNSALRSIKNRGLGALVVSHDYRAVAELADRVLLLRAGAIAFEGPTSDFLRSSDREIQQLLNPPLVEARAYG